MHESLIGLVDKADMAIGAAVGVIDEEEVASLAAAARLLRLRLDYPDDLVIAALAGGTGSGKSSLFNAVAGAELADVGGVRPTTSEPMATASPRRLAAVSGYLAAIGISESFSSSIEDWLCLIDLPDTDSVEVSNRLVVEQLLPHLDAIVWVVDPEKYNDARLHHGYLRHLAGHERQFVFVMNQIDRVSEGMRPALIDDLARALRADGLSAPVVVATSASPPSGPPVGVSAVMDALESVNAYVLVNKVMTDLEQTCADLLARIGHEAVDFERRAGIALGDASRLVAGGEPDVAGNVLTSFLTALADDAGGLTGHQLERMAAQVPLHVQRAHELVEEIVRSPPRWQFWRRVGPDEPRLAEEAGLVLSQRLLAPARQLVQERGEAVAAIHDLAISIASVRRRLPV